MKVRSGFVSNSSSSSFIIAVAKVNDPMFVSGLASVLPNDGRGIAKSYTADQIRKMNEDRWPDVVGDGTFAEVTSFTGKTVRVSDLKSDDYVVVFQYQDGGDYDFWDEEAGEMNYDIEVDYFPKEIRNFALAMAEGVRGFAPGGQMAYGAGRDG